MTAASSNYKTYAKQPRTLTEETGFSGGMLWTGNNIDPTHLKTIVNFDYDDTTGFLKTRDPIVSHEVLDITGSSLFLDANKGTNFIGAYNMCATIIEDDNITFDTAGWLYLFGNTYYADKLIHTCTMLQALYKAANGFWYIVDCSGIDVNTIFVQLGTLKPILLDNVLYLTTADSDRAFAALRLEVTGSEEPSDPDDPDTHSGLVYSLKEQPVEAAEDVTWESYNTLVNYTTLLEAVVTGFNAARGEQMFVYTSTEAHDPNNKYILGAYLTDVSSGEIVVSPRIGQHVRMNIIINGTNPSHYLNIFKLKPNGNSEENTAWEYVRSSEDADEYYYDYVVSDISTCFAITYTSEPSDLVYDTTISQYDSLLPITFEANNTMSNLKVKAYSLPEARASCLWNNRLVLWGCERHANTLFISEANNFYYFPVPNNVALFETNIISCIPYLGSLLVFTADKIYKLSEKDAGTFIQEVIQNDMPLSQEDASYLRTIKNMVLFKSGKYYYMLVPKSQSLTGELTIAPIYKNIAGLLNNLKVSVSEIIKLLYPEQSDIHFEDDVTIADNPDYIYAEQDTVRILYNIQVGVLKTTYTLFLNYNTNLRAWTVYIEDTTNTTLAPAFLTASREMSFIRVDKYVNARVYEASIEATADETHAFRSLIDTGYRTLSNSLKKRFREVQVKLYNTTENITAFGSAFLVDGVTRRNYISLKEVVIDEATNTVSLSPDYDINTFITEPSMSIDPYGFPAHLSEVTQQTNPPQGSDSIELSDWKLDFSHFKREAPTTVRIPVSGKGYAPRFILMTPNSLSIYINEINWVYRLMYGR